MVNCVLSYIKKKRFVRKKKKQKENCEGLSTSAVLSFNRSHSQSIYFSLSTHIYIHNSIHLMSVFASVHALTLTLVALIVMVMVVMAVGGSGVSYASPLPLSKSILIPLKFVLVKHNKGEGKKKCSTPQLYLLLCIGR